MSASSIAMELQLYHLMQYSKLTRTRSCIKLEISEPGTFGTDPLNHSGLVLRRDGHFPGIFHALVLQPTTILQHGEMASESVAVMLQIRHMIFLVP